MAGVGRGPSGQEPRVRQNTPPPPRARVCRAPEPRALPSHLRAGTGRQPRRGGVLGGSWDGTQGSGEKSWSSGKGAPGRPRGSREESGGFGAEAPAADWGRVSPPPRTCTARARPLPASPYLARRVLAARPRGAGPGERGRRNGGGGGGGDRLGGPARRGGAARRLGDAATREGAEAGAGGRARGCAQAPPPLPSSPSRLLSLPFPLFSCLLLLAGRLPALLLIPYPLRPSPFPSPFFTFLHSSTPSISTHPCHLPSPLFPSDLFLPHLPPFPLTPKPPKANLCPGQASAGSNTRSDDLCSYPLLTTC